MEKDENITKGPYFKNFSGIWTNDEAEEIERIIAEFCEVIYPEDWK